MHTNDHPQDSIPAFVLGTLDIDEALLVHAHVVECPGCHDEVEAFQALLSTLPYAATPRQPPAHIKQQLLARIAAASAEHAPSRPAARPPSRTTPRWMQAATGGALILSLAFGMMFYNTTSQVASIGDELDKSKRSIANMNQQLSQGNQALTRLTQQHTQDQTAIAQISGQQARDAQAMAQMQTQIAYDQQVTMFMSAPQTLSSVLEGTDPGARATIYLQPGNRQAVLVIAGMRPAAPGKIYQFWLATPGIQIPSATFNVADDGRVVLQINAPAPFNQFDQAMVTIEQAGGAAHPSDAIVLSGALSKALPASSPQAD